MTGPEAFNNFIAEGYMCNVITKQTNLEIDLRDVKFVAGEFNIKDLDRVTNTDRITFKAVQEIIKYGKDRKSWLVFGTSISHAINIAKMFKDCNVRAEAVHSGNSDDVNEKILDDFKKGKIQAIANNNKLTTGFDHPGIDLIGVLRATTSPGLWVQMIGRGTRPAEGKKNCLVLDFARNTKRLGPINDPIKPKKPGEKRINGEIPVKICPECQVYNSLSARICINCKAEFKITPKFEEYSSNDVLLKKTETIIEWYDVRRIMYNYHIKKNAPPETVPTLRVSYICGLQMITEWICLEHKGYVQKKAANWWLQRSGKIPPNTVAEAVGRTDELMVPRRIKVCTSGKYPEILEYEW
jgi:DNA repair protein RadD